MATNRKLRQHRGRLQLASCSQCRLKLQVGCTALCAPHYVHHIVYTTWCTVHISPAHCVHHVACNTLCMLDPPHCLHHMVHFAILHAHCTLCTTLHVVQTAMHIGSLGAHNSLSTQGAECQNWHSEQAMQISGQLHSVYLC